ncbi:MAG: hypothetical protein R2774_11050 [Saprospiraceae bacterium]
MYYIRDISVHFGERPLLKKVSFMVSPRDRVGLSVGMVLANQLYLRS